MLLLSAQKMATRVRWIFSGSHIQAVAHFMIYLTIRSREINEQNPTCVVPVTFLNNRQTQAKAQEVADSEALGRHPWKVSGSESEGRGTGDMVGFLYRDQEYEMRPLQKSSRCLL